MKQKIFVLSYHDLSSDSEPRILYYYSSKRKALRALRDRAKYSHVKVYEFAFYASTQFIYSGGDKFYYTISEIVVL